jgi:hypothetical protein
MNSSRRDFLLRTGLVSLGGSGLLLSACGGGGGGTGGGTGGGGEGLLNYGSQELPTKAYGKVPAIRSTSGAVTSTSNVTLPGVAAVVASSSNIDAGANVTLSVSLEIAKAVTFIATVTADITSRISYGIDVSVSAIHDSGKVQLAVDLPVEMQSKDPNTIVVAAYITLDDSESFMPLTSNVSVDKQTVVVDIPKLVFQRINGQYKSHIVVAEIQASRRPGTRPVDYSPNAQRLTVASDVPAGFTFTSRPLDRNIEIVSRVGMRESTGMESWERRPHAGVDLRVDERTKVLAVADGFLARLIDFNTVKTGQGNFLSIDHGDVATQYLHLASIDPGILAKIGGRPRGGVFVGGGPLLVRIEAGEVLGVAGNTSTSNVERHLHLNVVPSGKAWADSKDLLVVYNPESLLEATLVKESLLSEFLCKYRDVTYKSDDVITVTVGKTKSAEFEIIGKDSVFRDVPLPSDDSFTVKVSNSDVLSAEVVSGKLRLTVKTSGKCKVRISYKDSQQSPFAYGEFSLVVATSDPPLTLAEYKAQMIQVYDWFKVGRTEVTVAMWKEFCQATNRKMPEETPSWGWIDAHPMVYVGFDDAVEYANWAKLSMPTTDQWMLAATNNDGRWFAWGGYGTNGDKAWDPSKSAGVGSTAPVGSIDAGVSAFGCYDMTGNVWEWTVRYRQGERRIISKGGAWNSGSSYYMELSYEGSNQEYGYDDIGFRLVSNP